MVAYPLVYCTCTHFNCMAFQCVDLNAMHLWSTLYTSLESEVNGLELDIFQLKTNMHIVELLPGGPCGFKLKPPILKKSNGPKKKTRRLFFKIKATVALFGGWQKRKKTTALAPRPGDYPQRAVRAQKET